ncbi:hypothetical protein E3N88_40225 [Mikania micrantha]|uniref:Uncharacterized protein n=1 Tax=Mikania micrantha TaxID=192012 RepID=A0A5N6LPB3_9ASTR|nr:hypothetical protein E3N88_40225 [Mikania micrantha]
MVWRFKKRREDMHKQNLLGYSFHKEAWPPLQVDNNPDHKGALDIHMATNTGQQHAIARPSLAKPSQLIQKLTQTKPLVGSYTWQPTQRNSDAGDWLPQRGMAILDIDNSPGHKGDLAQHMAANTGQQHAIAGPILAKQSQLSLKTKPIKVDRELVLQSKDYQGPREPSRSRLPPGCCRGKGRKGAKNCQEGLDHDLVVTEKEVLAS